MVIYAILGILLLAALTIYLANKYAGSNLVISESEIPESYETMPSGLKFESAWFSSDYVTPYYYHPHRGWTAIKTIGKPILGLEDNWLEDVTYKLGNGNFSGEKARWATVADCIRHQIKMKSELKRINISLAKQREDLYRSKQEAFKRANS